MKSLSRYWLLAVVFLTGAAVLVIEVVAVRILSPFFGNTIYNYSSVLAVILGALSLGYFYGGRLADKHPTPSLFYFLIAASGISVMVLYLLMSTVLTAYGYTADITTGPIVFSFVLFFVPALILGMLSPFAIKLQSLTFSKHDIGKMAGEIFFASTVGSIVGSLLTGFYFIPTFGIRTIIIGTACFLLALGTFGMYVSNVGKKKVFSTALVGMFLLAVCTTLSSAKRGAILYAADGVYEKLLVFDGTFEGRPTRFLVQDRSSSAAAFVGSHDLVFPYTQLMSAIYAQKPDTKNALFLGAGAYSLPIDALTKLPQATVDVVEIEERLLTLAKTYFDLPGDSRLVNHVQDGRRFLVDTKTNYDVIVSDVYHSLYSIPTHMTTKEFFEISKTKLSPNGIFIANVISDLGVRDDSFFYSEVRTFREVFPHSLFFAVTDPTSSKPQNTIFLGFNGDTLSLPEEVTKHTITLSDEEISRHAVLTDDYAPVDTLVVKTIQSAK